VNFTPRYNESHPGFVCIVIFCLLVFLDNIVFDLESAAGINMIWMPHVVCSKDLKAWGKSGHGIAGAREALEP
jgi:hypothetical protein